MASFTFIDVDDFLSSAENYHPLFVKGTRYDFGKVHELLMFIALRMRLDMHVVPIFLNPDSEDAKDNLMSMRDSGNFLQYKFLYDKLSSAIPSCKVFDTQNEINQFMRKQAIEKNEFSYFISGNNVYVIDSKNISFTSKDTTLYMLAHEGKSVSMTTSGHTYSSLFKDGEFPNIKEVVPKENLFIKYLCEEAGVSDPLLSVLPKDFQSYFDVYIDFVKEKAQKIHNEKGTDLPPIPKMFSKDYFLTFFKMHANEYPNVYTSSAVNKVFCKFVEYVSEAEKVPDYIPEKIVFRAFINLCKLIKADSVVDFLVYNPPLGKEVYDELDTSYGLHAEVPKGLWSYFYDLLQNYEYEDLSMPSSSEPHGTSEFFLSENDDSMNLVINDEDFE